MCSSNGSRHRRNRRHVRRIHFVRSEAPLFCFPVKCLTRQLAWLSRVSSDGSAAISESNLYSLASESTHPFADLPFDGLVGLGFPDVSGEEGLPSSALPIVDQMVKEVRQCWYTSTSPLTLLHACSESLGPECVFCLHERRHQSVRMLNI